MPSLKNAFKDIYKISIDVTNIKNAKGSIDEIAIAIKELNAEQAVYRMELAGCTKIQMMDALSKNEIAEADIQAALAKQANTLATTTNTVATTANNAAEEDALLEQWLLIAGEKAETYAKAENTTATNADTVATIANNAAKKKSFSIINMLKVLWAKLNAVIKANPFAAFLVVVSALGVAMGKIADRVYNAEKYAKKALDKSAEKVDNVKSEIESLNSELQTTQSRIDELNAKENLTLVEREELERLKETNAELEREIRLKQSILSEEQKEANKDAKKYFTTKKDSLEFESSYEGVEIHEKTDYIGAVEERIEKLQQYADGQIQLSEEDIEAYKDYVESTLADFMEEDDNLVEGHDDGILDRLDALYEKYDLYANGKASVTEKKIKDILAKADFQSASKQLEELGKSGELSIATLSSRFPELIEFLKTAGISAEELYQYIMALSNPDAINYDNVRKQLMSSLGFGETIDNASEAQLWNEISSLGEEEVVLEAYLKVRDQYGEHPEGWNAKDWIANIQSELETELLEVNVSFEDAWTDSYTSESDAVKELADNLLKLAEQGRLTKETFNETDSTDYFKNLGISADEAIFKINKLVDESKQLSSMASQISSISNALGTKLEDGFVSADTLSGFDAEVRGLESWDRFQTVLGSTTSSYEECQEAANALATEWVNSSDFLAQLTDENKEYYETQLQAMGIENYEEVIAYAQELNSAKEALAQASFDVATATDEEIQSLIAKGTYSELAQQQIWNLVLAEQVEEGITLDTSADCQNLLALAQNAGVTGTAIDLLTQLLEIYNNLAAGTYGTNAQVINAVKNKAESLKNQINDLLVNGANSDTAELDPKIKVGPSATKSAAKAGKDAADAYLEAFEKELEELETLRDQGKITEKQYLDYLRKLYEKYFKNIDKYAKNFAENQAKYLQGMKSLYESALSGITSILDKQISAYEDSKSAAVDALEAERDAAIEAKEAEKARYEEEIKSIDKEIDAKEKTIDSINDEINAIREANDERQRQLDLQKAQYELERMQNQKTILQYSSDKGMHYVTDTSGVRDAKDAVEDAQTEITIANKEKEIDLIEKEIDLLEERKDLINEQIDLLDEQIDQINEQYDKLIADTEKYWDNLIKGMEDYKSRWEELAEIEEQAKIIETLRSLGIETDDILNMSEEAFARFKDEYIGILADIYSGNDSMLSALSDTTGRSVDEMGSYITATQGYIDSLSGIGESLNPVAEAIGNVDENMGSLSSAASEANTNLSETTSATNEIADNVGSIADNLNQMPDSQNIMNLSDSFSNLAESIGKVAQALGISEGADINTLFQAMTELNDVILGNEGEGIIGQFTLLKNAITDVINTIGLSGEQTVGSLMQAIDGLNTITLNENIVTQFNNLKAAIDSVTSAISGGGGSSDGEGTSGSESISGTFKGGKQAKKGLEGGGGNSLTGAIESIGDTANKVIGAPEATGDGTVIGEFGSLETAVNDVTTAIGGGDSESGEGQDTEGSDNLTDSITNLGTTTKDTLGESGGDGVIGRFEKFKDVIGEADEHVDNIFTGLNDINNTTVECTIKVHIESDGSIPHYASGTALGAMNLESAEYNAKYEGSAHVSGTANVTGNWGVRKPGKSLVGEIGQEIWVHSADGTFETVGDNGPEWIKTEKGDLIFNHLQTKELLDKGNIVKTGKAYANGNIQYSDGTVIRPNGEVLEPLQPGDKMYDMLQKFKVYMDSIDNNVEKLSSHITYEHNKQINEVVNQITNSSVVNNNRNVQQPVINGGINITCPGVTSKEVAQQVGVEVNRIFNGMHLEAEQRSRMR